MRKWSFIFSTLLFTGFLSAQIQDTVEIHRPILFGIHYHKCHKLWFGGIYSCSVNTKQDEFLTNDSIYYFKVYSYSGKLMLEGKKIRTGELCGKVKFYYKNGQLKESRYYRDFEQTYADTISQMVCDGSSPWGTWKYYDKKGRVRKTIVFSSEKNINKKSTFFRTTTTFGRKGEIISMKKAEHHPCYF